MFIGKIIIGGAIIILFILLILYGIQSFAPTPSPTPTPTPQPTEQTVEGLVSQIFPNVRKLTIVSNNGKETEAEAIIGGKIIDEIGNAADFFYLRRGFTISAKGKVGAGNVLEASEIKVLKSPNIIVLSPQPNDEVGLPLTIDGEARVFENTVNYRLKDQDGTILMENFTTALSPDIGLYGIFHTSDSYPEPKGGSGIVEVFDYSAKDGSEIDKVTIPVRFKKTEFSTVKVFFGNSQLDPGAQDCKKVFSVSRRIPKTSSVAREALMELLKGPNSLELEKEYFTSINPGVTIQALTIDAQGTARADFDETLERAVGGSCRVASIRSQITETLKQFPTVKQIIISIDGRTEDILQP